jgi:dTDP-4-dehydrorhamnose 3,5-epimerase
MLRTTTPIAGLLVLEPCVFEDKRGWFTVSFNQQEFDEALDRRVQFVQDNHSFSKKGVLRGLHFQLPPHAQGKLVRVTHGVVWDVAVDLRTGSPTQGQWFGLELSARNHKQLWIPEGFAHGFVVLSEEAEVQYKTTCRYEPKSARSIRWDDPCLSVQWPICEPIISETDAAAPGYDRLIRYG